MALKQKIWFCTVISQFNVGTITYSDQDVLDIHFQNKCNNYYTYYINAPLKFV